MNIKTTSAERVKLLRLSCKMSRLDFARFSDISTYTLRAWEEGINSLTKKGAIRLSSAFNKMNKRCSPEWLLYGTGPEPFILGEAQINNVSSLESLPQPEDVIILREIEFFTRNNPQPLVHVIEDDSMLPNYKTGDYVAGNKIFGREIAKLNRCFCIVITAKNKILCRQLVKSKTPDRYNLVGINPTTAVAEPVQFDVDVLVAAEIVFHRRRASNKQK